MIGQYCGYKAVGRYFPRLFCSVWDHYSKPYYETDIHAEGQDGGGLGAPQFKVAKRTVSSASQGGMMFAPERSNDGRGTIIKNLLSAGRIAGRSI